jgi:hypothetical protein
MRRKYQEDGENYVIKNFIIFTCNQIKIRNGYKTLVINFQGKILLRRLRCR